MSIEPIHARPCRDAAVALLTACRLPTSDLADAQMSNFFYCGAAATPLALIGLEFCGSHAALLRSLAVAPGRRSHGLGAALVCHVEDIARQKGVRSMYLLTTTAESFFQRHGYVTADRRSAPPGIRATREFADLCPTSSAFLVKHLSG